MNCLVVGAGAMGAGIAEVTARAGLATWLYDLSEDLVEPGFARLDESLSRAVEKAKLVGLDVRLAIAEHLTRELGPWIEGEAWTSIEARDAFLSQAVMHQIERSSILGP